LGDLEQPQQGRFPPLKGDAPPDPASPQSSRRRHDQFVRNAHLYFVQTEASRLRLPGLLERDEPEVNAVLGQQAEPTVARVLDGKGCLGPEDRFEEEHLGAHLSAEQVLWSTRRAAIGEDGNQVRPDPRQALLPRELLHAFQQSEEALLIADQTGDLSLQGMAGQSDLGVGADQERKTLEGKGSGIARLPTGGDGSRRVEQEQEPTREETSLWPNVPQQGQRRLEGAALGLLKVP